MRVSPEQILPSQDFLKPHTIGFILECIQNGELDRLPPDPIVREDDDGNLIAIDGHNLIAVKLYRHEDIDVYLAKSADDGLPATTSANVQRNVDIRDKFNTVIDERAIVKAKGIKTFQDLLERYSSLFKE